CGRAPSPVLVAYLVVLPCDQNTGSFIVAVGQRDGKVRWRTPRPEAHSGHSTPILYTPAGGATQIIVPGSFLLTAYAVASGEKLWWVRGLSFELKSTPVVSGATLYIKGFGTPETQPGAKKAIEPFDDIRKQHADARGVVTLANLPNGRARPGIDLGGDGQGWADEWEYYRAAMASENGMLAIRMGGRGDVTDT